MLHLHGRENPETGMDKKVKRVQFSQNVEIRDPATRTIDKKDAKNFMVVQTSILLERDQIVLSPFDDMVWKQMMDYQVIRISQTGKPIYTSENEHSLDAFMLTIMGFTLEFPEITKILEEVRLARKARTFEQQTEKNLKEKAFGGERDVYSGPKPKREKEARDNPNWHLNKVAVGYSKGSRSSSSAWGRRGTTSQKSLTRAKF